MTPQNMEQNTNTNTNHVDFKDVDRIEANLNPHARMFGRRRTGMTARQQRDFARAVKRARFMALVPYVRY